MIDERQIRLSDRFVVVGLVSGATAEDQDHARLHPRDCDLVRPVVAGEPEASGAGASGVTHVYVYAERDFDGRPTGQRHRMLLRRAQARR